MQTIEKTYLKIFCKYSDQKKYVVPTGLSVFGVRFFYKYSVPIGTIGRSKKNCFDIYPVRDYIFIENEILQIK